jgi:hypothetical protein
VKGLLSVGALVTIVVSIPDAGALKAELISMGRVLVPRELLEGYRLSRSTAGPGAGHTSLALGWPGPDGKEHRVKLAAIMQDDGEVPLVLARSGHGADLELRSRDGRVLIARARLLPIAMHAPDHCFINIEGECIHDCAFCTATRAEGGSAHGRPRSADRWVELIVEAHKRRPFPGVAITSVDPVDHEGLMRDYESIIRGVLEAIPGIVVGVEPPARTPEDILRLRRAGATELKINIQTPDGAILARVCPGWDLEHQYHLLEVGVRAFGRGHVTSNIIVGLGESDTDVLRAIDRMVSMGVVPTVRVLRSSDLNRDALERALGHPLVTVPPERHIRLAIALSDALTVHGLDARGFRTMCHSCMGCDLEPGVDI